ncbi:MAG: PD-(D/E)XK nuclease domain-containing protein [Desulfovibrio sp.]|nr:PD-(D/E)XK nuclease domain-containing protein [Desulfovibrio sp.]
MKLYAKLLKIHLVFFDTGGKNPDNFYHAFVLGLIVNLKNVYDIYSNRESGLGRYNICMVPKNIHERGIIIEFKTMKPKKEKDLKETCANALQQIQDKKYFTILKERGVASHSIYTYGFAFHGKEVLICGGLAETIGSLVQDEHVSHM